MNLHSSVFPISRITLLLMGLLGSHTALAATIPHIANCYSKDNGYDFYIANNSPFGSLQANNIYSSTYYKTTTGKFVTTPPSSVGVLSTSSFCYYDKSDYSGNWLSYKIGGYAFALQFWGSGDNYFLNLSEIDKDSWTTSDGTKCPGETGWGSAISATDTSNNQTICNDDYVVNIATAGLGGADSGIIMTIIDNPAGSAGGSQSVSTTSNKASVASSNQGRSISIASTAEETGRYALASRIINKTRWSVVRNPETLALSGVSYDENGLKYSKFVHCTFVSDDGNPDTYNRQSTYDCQIAEPCSNQQCDPENWQFMNESVTLPGTFFDRPSADDPKAQLSVPPAGGDADIQKALQLLPESTAQRKIHQTPDGKIKLISVNLLDQDWALVYSGQHLFAAVPRGAMGQPRFVHCQQTAANDQAVTMDCSEAYRCHVGPCTDDQWVAVTSIKLPQSFLSLPEPSSSDGGGCVLTPDAPFDPLFPILSLGALWYVVRRRRQA